MLQLFLFIKHEDFMNEHYLRDYMGYFCFLNTVFSLYCLIYINVKDLFANYQTVNNLYHTLMLSSSLHAFCTNLQSFAPNSLSAVVFGYMRWYTVATNTVKVHQHSFTLPFIFRFVKLATAPSLQLISPHVLIDDAWIMKVQSAAHEERLY